MLKMTTKQLYDLRSALDQGEGHALRAHVYFADQAVPGTPCATARDRQGVERVLVVWVDGLVINPENYEPQQLVAERFS